VALVLCATIGTPDNPPNPAADSLATTRKAYEADTLRLLASLDSLREVEARERQAKEKEIARLAAAEARIRSAAVTMTAAKKILADAAGVVDSLTAAIEVIEVQDSVIAGLSDALASSKAAFSRLTSEAMAAMARADSAEAGWARTRGRLGIAERALAIETARTSCHWNLILKRVECPSRGAIGVVALAVGVVGGLAVPR
jgi:hypothetical protein